MVLVSSYTHSLPNLTSFKASNNKCWLMMDKSMFKKYLYPALRSLHLCAQQSKTNPNQFPALQDLL